MREGALGPCLNSPVDELNAQIDAMATSCSDRVWGVCNDIPRYVEDALHDRLWPHLHAIDDRHW